MHRHLSIALRIIRAVAVLAVLFGIGAAGSSFEGKVNSKGIDAGMFGNGILAMLWLKDPRDGDMVPVWTGRICVVVGVALVVVITMALDRAKKAAAAAAGSDEGRVDQ